MSQIEEERQNSAINEFEPIQEHLNNLRIFKDKREINILLLGEAGVGKSTFINAFINYFTSFTLEKALKDKLQVAIPVQFTTFDENYDEHVVELSKDYNENIKVETSPTQDCSSCVCSVQGTNLNIRLIDTPGVGDPKGIDQDKINFDGVLSFISKTKYLHGICVLLKPNNVRLTVAFEVCIKQLLSRLDKGAIKNIIFVFTHTRGTSYRPGETFSSLKHLLSNIKEVDVPCEKKNIFCIDSEAFNFLATLKNDEDHSLNNIDVFTNSWTQSFDECLRMISYIAGDIDHIGLNPHKMKNTIAINKASRLILYLLEQTKTVFQLIRDNRCELLFYQKNLKHISDTLGELRFKYKLEDAVKTNILASEKEWQSVLNTMLNKANHLSMLEKERDVIIKTTAKLVCFLKTNIACRYDDVFEGHLEHLINNVQTGHEETDFEIAEQLVCMLSQYTEEKRRAMDAILQAKDDIKADDIFNLIESLHSLEISGPKIH